MEKRFNISRRALLALIGACLYQAAVLGTFINSHGVYMAAIKETMGLSMTTISAAATVRSVAGALLASALTMWFYRKNQCAVMFLSLLSVTAAYVLMIFTADNILWYVIPVLAAPISSTAILAVPHIMLQWFPKKSGTAAGIAMAFSGLGGVICNPVSARLCSSFGWKWAILIVAVVSMIMGSAGLFLIFILKGEPEKEENKASGGPVNSVQGVNAPAALRFLLCMLAVLFAASTVMVANLSIHLEELGYTLAAGASVTSAVMAGNISGKVILGWISDRIGIWSSFMIATVLVGLGMLVFAFDRNTLWLMYTAGFCFGLSYFCGTIGIAKCSLAAHGQELTKKLSGIHAGINGAVSAVLSFAAGPVFDSVGSFTPVFLFLAGICGLSFGASLVMLILEKTLLPAKAD